MATGTGGIVNVGFTCYANSVIQAFRHCYKIYSLFQEENYTKILKDDCKYNDFTKQFANIVQNLGKINNNSSVRPNGFWNEFKTATENTCFDHLTSREPHDAHEFLMFLLDSLHESLSREVTMNITKCELISEKQKYQQKSLIAWKEQFEKHYSPFVDLFFGEFHIQIICQKCKNVSDKFDTFNTLKGVFSSDNNITTIIDCLQADLNEEMLDDYACDVCKSRTKAIKKIRIWKLPKNLILVLKRFTYDGKKINTPIKPFDILHLESLFSEISPNKKKSNYVLQSTVDHHGSIHGGHYTAQAKHKEENKWYLYDDQNVNALENPYIGNSTYILFLEHV